MRVKDINLEDVKTLRLVRKGLGLSQHRLASMAGICRTTIAHVELGLQSFTPRASEKVWNTLARVIMAESIESWLGV
jgi:predicted transcriptional regulator